MGFDFLDDKVSLPKEWHFENIKIVLDSFPQVYNEGLVAKYKVNSTLTFYYNTILYSLGGAICVTLVPCLVSYIVSKYGKKFKILNIYTTIVIVCMSIPLVGSTASELQIAYKLKMIDQFWGQWFMKSYFLGMYYLVFLASFKTIPDSYMEAAKIDGAGNFSIMVRIMLPLVKNVFFTILLIKFIELWNDYQTPLLFLPHRPTISFALFKFTNSFDYTLSNATMQLAGCLVVFVPILIIFIIFQKRIMGNISMGGLKE